MTLFGYTFHRRAGMRWGNRPAAGPADRPANNLSQLPPGRSARVSGFLEGLSAERQAHLQSYGIVPGAIVRVVQHNPVTIIQVEHLELALERSLAEKVQLSQR